MIQTRHFESIFVVDQSAVPFFCEQKVHKESDYNKLQKLITAALPYWWSLLGGLVDTNLPVKTWPLPAVVIAGCSEAMESKGNHIEANLEPIQSFAF